MATTATPASPAQALEQFGELVKSTEAAISEPKSGIFTTEFWGTRILQLVGIAIALGMIGNGSPVVQLVGAIGTFLVELNYTWGRHALKKAHVMASAPANLKDANVPTSYALTAPPGTPIAAAVAGMKASQSGKIDPGLLAFVAAFGIVVACTAADRAKAFDGAFAAEQAVGSAWNAYDLKYQEGIVAAGSNKADVDTKLAAWRNGPEARVLKAEIATLQLIAAGKLVNSDTNLAAATQALATLTAELKADGIPIP